MQWEFDVGLKYTFSFTSTCHRNPFVILVLSFLRCIPTQVRRECDAWFGRYFELVADPCSPLSFALSPSSSLSHMCLMRGLDATSSLSHINLKWCLLYFLIHQSWSNRMASCMCCPCSLIWQANLMIQLWTCCFVVAVVARAVWHAAAMAVWFDC